MQGRDRSAAQGWTDSRQGLVRQTDKRREQAGSQPGKHTETGRQADRQTGRQTESQAGCQLHSGRSRQTFEPRAHQSLGRGSPVGLPEAVAASPAPERVQGGEEEEGEEDVVRAPHRPAHRAAGSSPERVRKR